jgi:low temperature requirement protein LtrA
MALLRRSASQAATLVTAVLGGVLLGQALDSTLTAYAVATGAAGGVAALSAARMATSDSFDARLTAALVCAVSGLLALLSMAVGVPGRPATDVSVSGATLVACGFLVPLLLVRRHRPGVPEDRATRPYAP